MLSIQDSNLDWLIQSQMCYHYTNGQTWFAFIFGSLFGSLRVPFIGLLYLSKAGAKIRTFFDMAKLFFVIFHYTGINMMIIT